MEKNKEICGHCKWMFLVDAKCSVCEQYNKFEPVISSKDLLAIAPLLDKSESGDITTIYQLAVLKWGQELQTNMIAEESVELMIASLEYNYQDNQYNDYSYNDIIISLGKYIKQLLKDARKNKFSLNEQPFEIESMMQAFTSMFSLEMKKHMGKQRDTRDEFIGELADVEIMLGQARHGMGLSDEIDQAKRSKIERLHTRLNA